MLNVGDYAVVVDYDCCEGFEEGTCVEIVKEGKLSDGDDYYTCKSHSPERIWYNLQMLHCSNCLHPIKAVDACPEVHSEH